ncbi:hypothetical protein EVAR_6192_1 [Eumeta japonica]|uniref:Uncharacterized protein n=1 Tax=Eumeta variegata TaxID=151549 RepID=A0A4C2A1A0_EUMVA|nr:hypothetical protein EVAR_6192_1 [Eumeta japonica]
MSLNVITEPYSGRSVRYPQNADVKWQLPLLPFVFPTRIHDARLKYSHSRCRSCDTRVALDFSSGSAVGYGRGLVLDFVPDTGVELGSPWASQQ